MKIYCLGWERVFLIVLLSFASNPVTAIEVSIDGVGGLFIDYIAVTGTRYSHNIDPRQIQASIITKVLCACEDEGNELIIVVETDNGIKTIIYDMTNHQIALIQ